MIFRWFVMLTFLSAIINLFGVDSFITKFFVDNVVWTAYNIVSIILIICYACNIWLGKKKTKILYKIISFILLLPAILKIIYLLFPNIVSDITNSILEAIIIFITISAFVVVIVVVFKIIKKYVLFSECKNPIFNKKSNINIENKTVVNKDLLSYKKMAIEDNSNKLASKPVVENAKKEISNKVQEEVRKEIDYISKYEYYVSNRMCPQCHSNLRARTNSYDGTYFLGCSSYGKTGCNFTIDYSCYYNIKDKVNRKEANSC